MTPPAARRLALVIFDCDGVLVDSEGPANRAVAAEITALGWPMTEAESMARFIGYTLEDIAPVVETHLGRAVPDGWGERLRQRVVDVMRREATLIPGAEQLLAMLDAMGLPYRVASNSGRAEMAAKFARTGLDRLMAVSHSANDVLHGKPAPDVYLAAAAAGGVPPASCMVVEDSVPGAMAAAAAGMTCFGLAPHGDGAALQAVGALPIRSLLELPPLFRAAMREAA